MRKEFEIRGCVEVPLEVTEDVFTDKLIDFVESNGWYFGGGINEIKDGVWLITKGFMLQFATNCLVCVRQI